jgi:molecular chaperone GrpE
VDGPTVTAVLRHGYRLGDRLIRPAMVAVADRAAEPTAEPGPEGRPGDLPPAAEPYAPGDRDRGSEGTERDERTD